MADGKAKHDFLLWSELVATLVNVNTSNKDQVVRGADLDPFRARQAKAIPVDILKDVFVKGSQ